MNDLKFAFRQLLKNPGFSAVAVLTLALGIGANTVIFSALRGLLFKTLPFCDSDRVVGFTGEGSIWGDTPGLMTPVSYGDYLDFCRLTNVFSAVAAAGNSADRTTLRFESSSRTVRASLVSANYFAALRVNPVLGRAFLPEEGIARGSHPVAVISHRLWRTFFDADPKIVGTSVQLNQHFFTIIGVAPERFRGDSTGSAPDLWAPIMMTDWIQLSLRRGDFDLLTTRGQDWLRLIGVLRDGIRVEQAAGAVRVADQQIQRETRMNVGRRMSALQLKEVNRNEMRGFRRIGLYVQMLAVALLLIVCANVAGLLLVQAAGRSIEMAIRLSLGSGRMRLIQQLLTESILLALASGGLGVLFAFWGTSLLTSWLHWLGSQQNLQVGAEFGIDTQVLFFALALSGVTGAVFGLAPALSASRVSLAEAIKRGISSSALGGRKTDVRDVLSVCQVAATLALLMIGCLFLKSSLRLLNMKMGFDNDRLLAVPMDFEAYGISVAERATLTERILAELRRLPGVQTASLTQYLPCTDANRIGTGLDRGGDGTGSFNRLYGADDTVVEVGFFRTAGIPIVRGRGLLASDSGGPPVIVVSESLAVELWPNDDAVGKQVRIDRLAGTALRKNARVEGTWVTIVGVAHDVGPSVSKLQPSRKNDVYRPLPSAFPAAMHFLIRAKADPRPLIRPVRDMIQGLDSRITLVEPRIYRDFLGPFLIVYRDVVNVVVCIGIFGLVLASIGVYGTVNYAAQRRFKELGIRAALGATRTNLVALVFRRGMIIATAGIIAGQIGAFWMTKFAVKLLLGMETTDPYIILGVSAFAGLILATTGLTPAFRAAKVDPMEALRYE